MDFIDHKDRPTGNLIVVRLFEKEFYVTSTQLLKLLTVDTTAPDDIVLTEVGDARVPIVLDVVVGPHQVELHTVAVMGFHEAVGERGLHEGSPVEPIPVEDEYVDTMAGSLVNLHLHHRGVGLVDVSPQRMAVPIVSRVALLHRHHRLPLAHAQWPEGPQARVVGGIGRIYIGCHVIVSLYLSLCREGKGHQQRQK